MDNNPWQNNQNRNQSSVPPSGGGNKARPVWPWVIGAIGITFVLVMALMSAFPDTLESEGNRMSLTHSLLLLGLIGGSLMVHVSQRPKKALRDAALWVLIGSVLFVGYSFRHEFGQFKDRLTGELLPHKPMAEGEAVTIRAGHSQPFMVMATINGTDIRFMVDTGASDVTLTPQDAQRLGYDLGKLRYDKVYRTANGMVHGAPVRLSSIRIGHLQVNDVRASVNSVDMGSSLLGMSFLSRLSRYEVNGDKMTFYP